MKTRGAAILPLMFWLVLPMAAAQNAPGDDAAKPLKLGQEGSNTFVGIVSDSHCGAKHKMSSGKSPQECARTCVRKNAKYVLVAGNRLYTLEGHDAELDRVAGQKARIAGSLEGSTVKVDSVEPAQ